MEDNNNKDGIDFDAVPTLNEVREKEIKEGKRVEDKPLNKENYDEENSMEEFYLEKDDINNPKTKKIGFVSIFLSVLLACFTFTNSGLTLNLIGLGTSRFFKKYSAHLADIALVISTIACIISLGRYAVDYYTEKYNNPFPERDYFYNNNEAPASSFEILDGIL